MRTTYAERGWFALTMEMAGLLVIVCGIALCVIAFTPGTLGYSDDEGDERRPSFQNARQYQAGEFWGQRRLVDDMHRGRTVLVDDVHKGRFNAAELDVIARASRMHNPFNYPRVGGVIRYFGSGYVLPVFSPVIVSNGLTPQSACDSDEQCAEDTDPLCMEHNGTHSDADTAEVQTNPSTGDQVCSADCVGGGTAVIACNRTIIDEPEPVGTRSGGNHDLADDH